MKSITKILALTFLLLTSPAFAADQPSVDKALTDWKAAIESANVDVIMKLYDKNAVMISTFAQEPMTKRDQIKGYFKKVVPNPDIKVDIKSSQVRLFGNVAVVNGRYDLSYTQDGEPINIPARYTFVYNLEGGKWLIVDQHSSRVPLPDEEK